MTVDVRGWCPMGCGQTLTTSGGRITCASPTCPRPTAVDELLGDGETAHVIEFRAEDFTVQHPLRERLDDGLFSCSMSLGDFVGPLGRYRAHRDDTGWRWEQIVPAADHD